MSTNAPGPGNPAAGDPNLAGVPRLYAGKSRSMGAELRRMQTAGSAVIRSQRARWQRNRLFYRGQQYLRTVGTSVRTLAPAERLPSGRRRDTINRLRQFTDGRIAILTHQPPRGQVDPAGRDQDSLDAARLATKFVDAQWGPTAWDLQAHFRRLALGGEQDGVCFQSVIFDPQAGEKASIAFTPDGRPVTDRAELEALQQEDPQGTALYEQRELPLGDVVFRVVRAGALFVDPVAQERFDSARYIGESRVVSRAEVEQQAGMSFEDLIRASSAAMGTSLPSGMADAGRVSVESSDGPDLVLSNQDGVLVHVVFVRAGPDWPQGAHIRWADRAPARPLLAEPWGDELPYRPYTPKPDGDHFLRSRGTVDDLAPVQARLNRTLSQIGEWLDRVARPTLVLQGGGLAADTPYVFNEEGFVKVQPGFAPPGWLSAPSEPVAVLTQHFNWLIEQMAEIAVVSDASRGTPPGQGIDAAVSLNFLAQSNEQQLSGPAAEFVDAMEWAVSRALYLVERHFTLPRLVSAPGVDDAAELEAFTGAALRGCNTYRVTGSILPRQRAAQVQTLLSAAQYAPGSIDLRSWLPQIIEGDLDEMVNHERAQHQRQKRENHRMAALARLPNADELWRHFGEMQAGYRQALAGIAQLPQIPGVPGAPTLPPEQQLAAKGVHPPTLADLLPQGMLPQVEEFDDAGQHMRTLDDWRVSDGFDAVHPLVKQAAHEHAQAHLQQMAGKVSAMAAQTAPGPGAGVPPVPGQAPPMPPPPPANEEEPEPAAAAATGSRNGKAAGGHHVHVNVGSGGHKRLVVTRRDEQGRIAEIEEQPKEGGG